MTAVDLDALKAETIAGHAVTKDEALALIARVETAEQERDETEARCDNFERLAAEQYHDRRRAEARLAKVQADIAGLASIAIHAHGLQQESDADKGRKSAAAAALGLISREAARIREALTPPAHDAGGTDEH